MLLIKTKIAPSPIEGMGLFAAEKIMKGMRIWKFSFGADLRVDAEAFDKMCELSPEIKEWLWKYSFQNPKTGDWIICADSNRFANHSEEPNAISIEAPDSDELVDIA